MHVCTQTFPTHCRMYVVYIVYIFYIFYAIGRWKKQHQEVNERMLVYFSSLKHGVIIVKIFKMNRQQFIQLTTRSMLGVPPTGPASYIDMCGKLPALFMLF